MLRYSRHSPAVVPRPSSLKPIRRGNRRQTPLAYADSYVQRLEEPIVGMHCSSERLDVVLPRLVLRTARLL